MCSINHDKKAIYIHIPKNGGSYIASILSKNYGFHNYYLHRPDHQKFCYSIDRSVHKHENKLHGTLMYYKTSPYINKIMNMNEEKWNNYYIFSFIRNPYDRIVSGWNYVNKYKIPFENYINIGMKANSFDYWHVFMPQTRHLIDNHGKIRCDFLGKFENIENDLKTILQYMGFSIIHIPFKKNSKKHDKYMNYYKNENIIKKVNIIIHEDLKNFDYGML